MTYDDGSSIIYTYDNAGSLLDRSVQVSLAYAITALQVLANLEPSSTIFQELDVDGDGRVGIEEAVFILQRVLDESRCSVGFYYISKDKSIGKVAPI